MPGPGHYVIGEEEKAQIMDLLEGGYFFRYGSEDDPNFKAKVFTFERECEKYFGVNHAVAVNSGTNALFTALHALGIGPGDEVIVPGYTFCASISTIVFARAVPVLAEIDKTFNLDPADVAAKITPRTKAIMCVHMLGNPARLDELKKIAADNNLFLIEDTAQACGASYKGKKCGTHGDIGTLSYNVYKTISAGDGGMVITDDAELYERSFGIHDQGHKPNRTGVEVGERSLIGLDFRMNELTGAVLLAQLTKLDSIIAHLHENKKRFKDQLADIPGLDFREITDEEGELGTLLTVLFPDKETTKVVADRLETKPVCESGWHVYSNMEHILSKRTSHPSGCPFSCPLYEGPEPTYEKGMLPQTDDILSRAINISIGVFDAGLGSAFGVKMSDGADVVDARVEEFKAAVKGVM